MLTELRGRGSTFDASVDVCIIGGGAAGITIAQRFIGRSTRVCIVESGGLRYEQATQALYTGTSVGQHVDFRDGRVRAFGGSMNHWGGRCGEFSTSELAVRPWIPQGGWPLGEHDLAPYYRQAWELCGCDAGSDFTARVRDHLGDRAFGAFGPDLAPNVWRFAPSDGGLFLNFGKLFYDAIRHAPNITLLTHANASGFETDEAETHVNAVRVRSLDGSAGRVFARFFVLCCSGIENPRLLLAGGGPRSPGIGNANGLVGRYFMEHARALAATLHVSERLSPIQNVLTEYVGADGVRYQTGIVLSEQAQRRQRLLNCSAVLAYVGDPQAGITAVQDIWRNLRDGRWPGDTGDDVWNALRDMPSIAANIDRERVGRPLLLPVVSAAVVVDVEQLPDPESRVTLSGTQVDALGSPLAVVDWRMAELERETARAFMLAFGADVARRGLGRLRLEPWLEERSGAWKSSIFETYHYIGATRMSQSDRNGVVDVDCRVHGVDNLFVGGSSVFPTGGHVNPTLTIVALAARLADHLVQRA